jgi:hypothetical protein
MTLQSFPIALIVSCVLMAADVARGQVLGEVGFPLHVTADGRRLEDVQGRPFLLNADTAWSLMVQLTKAETEAYLEDRRQKGFNAVLVNLIERAFGGPENAEGNAPFPAEDDWSPPGEAYFAHVDWVIDAAAAKGMLVLLAPAYIGRNCGSQGWCQQMLDQSVTAMGDYGRYIGNRYRTRANVLWVNGGDEAASDFSGVLSRVEAIVDGIREFAPEQLHTGHCSRHNSAIECYDEPWLDVNNTYSSCGGALDAVVADYLRIPGQLFFYIEGDYENMDASLGCLIDQQAWSMLAGATGHVFGNNPIWRFGAGWEDELDSPGSLAMKHLSDLFLSRAWFRLVPDTTGAVLVSGASDDANAAQTSDGESIVVYVPSSRTIGVNLAGLATNVARAWWFDPANGNGSAIGLLQATGTQSFSAPGRRLLVVDDAAANLPPPGSQRYELPEPHARDLCVLLGIAACALSRRRRAAPCRRR